MKNKKNKDFFVEHMNNLEIFNIFYDYKEDTSQLDDYHYAS